MRVVLVGLSHKTAPVQLREKLSFYGKSHLDALHHLRDATHLEECALLSTCNRTEIYGLTREEDWQEQLLAELARQGGVSPGQLQDHLYSFEGTPAYRHLFRVAAGLDSMVIGEGQILAQVKEMLQTAQEAGTSGTILHALVQQAIACGKRARTETEIGRGAVSVSLAAVQLAKQIFGRLNGCRVLLVGAGEMGEQTAKMLLDDSAATKLLVCNRTQDRAETLAAKFGGVVYPFERLTEALSVADIVIASTGAPNVVVTLDTMRRAMRSRRGRPIFLIDIAVPRDIDPDIADLGDDIYLYNIDDLQEVVEKNLAGRQAEVLRVEEVVQEDLDRFRQWLRRLEVGPVIQELQKLGEQTVHAEWQRVGGRLSHLSQRDRDVVETLVRGVVNKLLRHPILHLKDAADSGNGYHEVEHVRAVFRLNQLETAAEPPAPSAAHSGEETS